MTPDAVARAGPSARKEIVVDPRSRGSARVGERAYLAVSSPRLYLVLLAIAVVAISVIWRLRFMAEWSTHGTPFSDWQHYAMAWNRVIAGGSLYAPEQLTGYFTFPQMLFIGWAYPPAAVVLWAPFASWPAGWIAWTVVNVGLLLTALWAVATRTWPERRVETFALMLLVLSQFNPFIEAAQLGNPDLALAGLLMWAWIGGPRAAVLAGVVGGLAKIAPVAMLLYARRFGWRWTAYGVGALVVIGIATLPLVGLGSWFDYARSLSLAVAECAPSHSDNVAIACQFVDFVAGKQIGLLVAMGMAILAGLVPNRWLAFSLAAMTYPVANHDLRGHTWLPIVPVIVAYVTTIRSPRSSIGTASTRPSPASPDS